MKSAPTLAQALLVVALLLLVAGCGGDDHGGSGNPTATEAVPTATATQPPVGGRPPDALPPGPAPDETSCQPDSDGCDDVHTSLLAIAHAFTDPDNTVLYRVTVPAAPTNTDWGDGTNGFFYQATVDGGATSTYVPFNGIAVGDDNRPLLPQFSFIVAVDVSAGEQNTTLEIDLCTSNYETGDDPTCTARPWTDKYDSLPVPAVGLGPSDDPFNTLQPPTVLFDSETGSSASVPNNGVYPGVLEVCPAFGTNSFCATDLSDEQLQWFYDHLVFFDEVGNPYTNNILDDASASHRSIGVLTLPEAAFALSATEYRTRYGSTAPFSVRELPVKQLFFYSDSASTSEAITVGVQYLFDDTSCNGYLNGVGCGSSTVTGDVDVMPAASISPQSGLNGNVVAAPADASDTAGKVETRSIIFESRGSNTTCTEAVNPLAANPNGAPSDANDLQPNRPNYVIDDTQAGSVLWNNRVSPALYYVLPAGFGYCDSGMQPFCDLTSGYVSYVPHYQVDNGGGYLNGGSTDQTFVDEFVLADQYALSPPMGSSPDFDDQNSLVWFDNCGYGYVYEECTSGCDYKLGSRSNLPAAPNNGATYNYTISNMRPGAVVFGKECCASDYSGTSPTPPQQIDDTYALFVPTGNSLPQERSIEYDTLFGDEATVVYDAMTGNRLYKLRLKPDSGQLYHCTDPTCTGAPARDGCPSVSIVAGTGTDAYNVDLLASVTGPAVCAPIGDCPFGTSVGARGPFTTCTVTTSQFILGVGDWVDEVSGAAFLDTVQLGAWGARGANGNKDGSSCYGGSGGAPGFARTTLRFSDLADNLYAYVGKTGASSILATTPISSVTNPDTTEPTNSAYLIAGGGGGGGSGNENDADCGGGDGGAGGIALAPNSNPISNQIGCGNGGAGERTSSSGGEGCSDGAAGSPGASEGIGGYSDKTGWHTGTLIPPTSWSAGKGASAQNGAGLGGGGYGGGGGGGSATVGSGAGGGSWAAPVTVFDPFCPPTPGTMAEQFCAQAGSPPQGDGQAVQLAYLAADRTVLYRVNAGGPQLAATDGGPPWVADTVFLTAGGATTETSANTIDLKHHTLTGVACPPGIDCNNAGGGAPQAVFQSQRADPTSMSYAFPVTAGDQIEVRILLAETAASVTKPGQRQFRAFVDGSVPAAFNTIDPIALAGAQYRGAMVSDVVTASNPTLVLGISHLVGNPAIKGIEIRTLALNVVARGLLRSPNHPQPTACLSAASDFGAIVSNGTLTLMWQADGDLVLNDRAGQAVWRSGTSGTGQKLCFQSDGNLVVRDAAGDAIFMTNTGDSGNGNKGGVRMAIGADCNLTITNIDDTLLFQTHTTCTSSPLPTLTPTATATSTPTPPVPTRTYTPTPTPSPTLFAVP